MWPGATGGVGGGWPGRTLIRGEGRVSFRWWWQTKTGRDCGPLLSKLECICYVACLK